MTTGGLRWLGTSDCTLGHARTFLQNKVIHRRPIGKFNPMPTPEGQLETLSVDFIIELPDVHGFDAVMVVVDSVLKQRRISW